MAAGDSPTAAPSRRREHNQSLQIGLSKEAISEDPFNESPAHVERLRETLNELSNGGMQGHGRISRSRLLLEAGLKGGDGPKYDETTLGRFIAGKTREPQRDVASKLYERWVQKDQRIDLQKMPHIIYHALISELDVSSSSRKELANILCGDYHSYKRSTLNQDFYTKSLLNIREMDANVPLRDVEKDWWNNEDCQVSNRGIMSEPNISQSRIVESDRLPIIAVREHVQHQNPEMGIPNTTEDYFGYAFMKGGDIIYDNVLRRTKGHEPDNYTASPNKVK